MKSSNVLKNMESVFHIRYFSMHLTCRLNCQLETSVDVDKKMMQAKAKDEARMKQVKDKLVSKNFASI